MTEMTAKMPGVWLLLLQLELILESKITVKLPLQKIKEIKLPLALRKQICSKNPTGGFPFCCVSQTKLFFSAQPETVRELWSKFKNKDAGFFSSSPIHVKGSFS